MVELEKFLSTRRISPAEVEYPENVETIRAEAKRYQDAGFTEIANIKMQEVARLDAQTLKQETYKRWSDQGYILLSRPNFYSRRVAQIDAYTEKRISMFQVSQARENSLYIAEIPIGQFTGDAPMQIVDKAVEARRESLYPVVWAMGTTEELSSISKGQIISTHDPLLVGYPSRKVSEGQDGNIWVDCDFGVVLAMWGDDLKDLDEYFSGLASK
jgi:hypothetical protein